ncbi:MAG: D-aminoacylase [Chloroflexi bacterium]|nr:D-aminoacylase [Chloroflexota bacterium]
MTSFDLLIRGGTVVDGTGAAARTADVGVVGDRIAAIGQIPADAPTRRAFDASGRVVCPGFIDAHSHSDLSVLSDPRARSKVHQGITTDVVGNCGLGVAPLAGPGAAAGVREAIYIVDPDRSVRWTWTSMAEYLERVDRAGVSMNVAALAGHLAIHASVMGYDNRPGTPDELRHMERLLDEALEQGAVGLSTGLMYAPISFAPTSELVALGTVVAKHDRIFAMHMRNYGDTLLEAVQEAVRVGAESGCRVQVSHLAVAGRRNWGAVRQALAVLDQARARGVRLRHDSYPYLAGSANLSQLLPGWAHEGGTAAMVERLRTPADRARITTEWQTLLAHGWDEILVCWVRPEGDARVVGKTIAEIATERGHQGDVVALDLMAHEEGLINMIAFGRSDEDLHDSLRHPETMVGSDGLAVDPDGPSGSGHPHPRYYGCYPRLLGKYVREDRLLSPEQAIYKCTGLVAETFGFKDRGVIAEGRAADLVVFDPATVIDRATFLEPQRFPEGIETVVVNGTLVIDGRQHTGAGPGRVVRGS